MLPAGTATAPAPARPSVVFGEGRRPEATTTHVKVAEFQGPLALLLALIEARQLDVLTVPLGGLADAYLDALATLVDDRLGNGQPARAARSRRRVAIPGGAALR